MNELPVDFLVTGCAAAAPELARALVTLGWSARHAEAPPAGETNAATVLLLVGASRGELGAAADAEHPRKWLCVTTEGADDPTLPPVAAGCLGATVRSEALRRLVRTHAGAKPVQVLPTFVATTRTAVAAGAGGAEDSPTGADERRSWTRTARELSSFVWLEVENAREAALVRFRAELAAWPELQRECAAQYHRPHALATPRFDRRHVREVVVRAREKHPGARIFYLTDTAIPLHEPDVARLDSAREAADVAGPKVFVCAFFSDERLARALAEVKALPGAVYLTPLVFWPTSRYFHRNDTAYEVLCAEAALPQPKFALEDFENLIQALEATRALDGDYVEIGVFQGRSAHCVLQYLRRAGLRRRAWLLDIYEGFTYEAAGKSSDAFWAGTHTETSEAGVREWMAEFPDAHVVKANVITDPLPAGIARVAVANIDVDLYEAVVAAIERLVPRMVPGGILILEDQGHTPPLAGAWLAVKEFLDSPAARDFTPVHLASGQLFLIRR